MVIALDCDLRMTQDGIRIVKALDFLLQANKLEGRHSLEVKMLYGEIHVNLERLKAWSSSLNMSQTKYNSDHPLYTALELQLKLFQVLISGLKPGDDWRDVLGMISPLFQETFFETGQHAVCIANYYECFIIPANIETKKKIIQGYSENDQIGEVELYDGRNKVGSIGQKSDLIWSVFNPYFVIEADNGDRYHTLPNHEEFLTLQLWNVENSDEDKIAEYINNILLKLAIEKELYFKRANPIELWKSYGSAKTYEMQVGDKRLEAIPLTYLNYALTCEDPRMAFLHFYQVLEYFFVRAQNKHMISELQNSHVLTAPVDDALMRRILKSYTNYTREVESLKLVLQQAVDVQELKNYISETEQRRYQYTADLAVSDRIQIRLDATDAKIINKLAERIYFFRCAIAHAKGDVDEYLALPDVSDSIIRDELALLKIVAYKVLLIWGK